MLRKTALKGFTLRSIPVRLLHAIFLLLTFSATTLAAPNKIPLNQFSHMPMVQAPDLSPDGNTIAVILNQEASTQVAVVPFDDNADIRVVLKLDADKYRIESLAWANNERLIVTVSQPLHLPEWGMRVRTTHLYSVKTDGSGMIELRRKARERDPSRVNFYRNSPTLFSLLHQDPDHILVTVSDRSDEFYSSIFKVNIVTGLYEKHVANSNRIVEWGATLDGEVLLGIGVDKNRHIDTRYLYTRDNIDADWEKVKTFEPYVTETFSPVIYEPQTRSIIVISDHKLNKEALWRFDIATGEYTLLGEAPGDLDVSRGITRLVGTKNTLVGFTYTDNYLRRAFFDEGSQALSQEIGAVFGQSGLQASLYDWDQAKNRHLIFAVSDKSPGKFYTYDKTNNSLGFWYSMYPHLEKANLASVQPFKFDARDGMKLNGYLTLPNDVNKPPVVVFPHGGPFDRDTQHFDPYVQMFASRGYAVLQVNFRGSTGYGRDYFTAGHHEWGKKMQTDLLDALAWLKNSKLADTDNACIVGTNYGGYAALTAAYQSPQTFKCVVSLSGSANMRTSIVQWRREGNEHFIEKVITQDEVELTKLSPIYHAKEFNAPVLLIHGKVDDQVSFRQTEDMYIALKRAKKKVKMKLYKFGSHNLEDEVSLRGSMALVEGFLDKHLN